MKIAFAAFLIVGLSLFVLPRPVSPVVPEEHIRQVIHSLPADSEMRAELERGDRGDGIHHPWMDYMRDRGIRRARAFLSFSWRGRPTNIHVERMAFFKAYDMNCSQISDPAVLNLIKSSGLYDALGGFAADQTARSRWTYLDKKPKASEGTAILDLLDDEWLPVLPASLFARSPESQIMIDGDLMHLQKILKTKRFPQDELDGALIEASGYLDDECTMKSLLSAGADPNVHNDDNETPLMFAAMAGLSHNAKALLGAGADTKAKNFLGQTAEDIARRRGHDNIVQILHGVANTPD